MPLGQKHLVQCRCILPQFKKLEDPPLHQFVVFSVIDDDDNVLSKLVQCNNCGAVHKVTDINKSEIIANKENLPSSLTISDIKSSLSQDISAVLESNDCDISTWEFVKFVIENKQFGSVVILSSESSDGLRQGKYIKILSERLFKIDQFSRNEIVGEK